MSWDSPQLESGRRAEAAGEPGPGSHDGSGDETEIAICSVPLRPLGSVQGQLWESELVWRGAERAEGLINTTESWSI